MQLQILVHIAFSLANMHNQHIDWFLSVSIQLLIPNMYNFGHVGLCFHQLLA